MLTNIQMINQTNEIMATVYLESWHVFFYASNNSPEQYYGRNNLKIFAEVSSSRPGGSCLLLERRRYPITHSFLGHRIATLRGKLF